MSTEEQANDEQLTGQYEAILNMNQEIFAATRKIIEHVSVVRDAYIIQAARCDDVIAQLALGAQVVASSNADILTAEFNIEDLLLDRETFERSLLEDDDD